MGVTWFVLANFAEFLWRFNTAGLKNQLDDVQAAKKAEQVSFRLDLADRTPIASGTPSALAVRVLVLGTAKAQNCRIRVVKIVGDGYIRPGLDGATDFPLAWDSPDTQADPMTKSFYESAMARLCRTDRMYPNIVCIEASGGYEPPNLQTEHEYVLSLEITADNAPRTVQKVRLRAYRFIRIPPRDGDPSDTATLLSLDKAKWDAAVLVE